MLAKKIPALVQRHRMRKHLANVFELYALRSDQIVRNAQPHFSVNKNIALKKKIKVLTYGAGQSVLHRDHRSSGLAGIQSVKNLCRGGSRQHISAAHKLQRRLMAECSTLSLDGHFHGE